MGQLHSRNGRRPFAPPDAFYAESLPAERFQAEIAAGAAAGRDSEDPGASRAWGLLAAAPYLLPFKERARVFQSLVSHERAQHRDDDAFTFPGFPAARQFVTVRRGQVLPDAYAVLSQGPGADTLRGRVRIRYVSEQGLEEAGVDGGGIFKEFLGDVVKEGFDPGVGLFRATTDNRLFPNPRAPAVVPGAGKVIEFLGRMVGKAMWEGTCSLIGWLNYLFPCHVVDSLAQ
jgi:ubiquitin-protein ligase E3 C